MCAASWILWFWVQWDANVYENALSYSDLSLLISCFLSQPDVKTIEGVLFNALVKVGAVSQDNADNPTKVNTPIFNLRLIQSHDII